MNLLAIVNELEEKDIYLGFQGETLKIRSHAPIPQAVKERLRPIKNEILGFLRHRETENLVAEVAGETASQATSPIGLEEARKLFKERGWIRIYSGFLKQSVYLVRDSGDQVPDPAITRYTKEEVEALKDLTLDELRTLHEAKCIFGGELKQPQGGRAGKISRDPGIRTGRSSHPYAKPN